MIRYTYLVGRCWNGAQRDHGTIIHAIDDPGAYPAFYGKALCGVAPGRRSNGWSDYNAPAPTCPRCLAKLAKHPSTNT